MLTAVSKKAAHFTLFVKHYFENSCKHILKIVAKKLGPAFLRDPDFLNLVTLGFVPAVRFYLKTTSVSLYLIFMLFHGTGGHTGVAFKELAEIFQIRYADCLCHFANGIVTGLQEYDCFLHP